MFDHCLLSDNCMQDGTLNALVLLILGHERLNRRSKSRVIMSGGRQPLSRMTPVVGVLL
jgi:hypothetical protein